MAYSLAKIDIRELKANQPVGVQTFELILGLIPIEVEGYTQIADSTEPAADEWSYFPKIKTLKINNSVLQAEQYLKYSLLVSNKNSASYALDPTNAVATKYIWPPYLKSAPTVTESGKNILEGIITYNSISIDIQTSTDTKTANYFGSNFSIMNQDFSLFRITNTGTITKLYTGIGTGVSASSTSIKIETKPKIQLLDEPAYYNLVFTSLFVNPTNPNDFSQNPWYATGSTERDLDEIPIICASVLPYTLKTLNGQDERYSLNSGLGTVIYYPSMQSCKHFDSSTLVKIRANHQGSELKVWTGIVFTNWNESNYNVSDLPSQLFNRVTPTAIQCQSAEVFTEPYWQNKNPYLVVDDTDNGNRPLPCDWGMFQNNLRNTAIIKNWFIDDQGDIAFRFLAKRIPDLSSNSFTPKRRFKMLFTNNDNLNKTFDATDYRNLADTDGISDVTTSTSTSCPRLMPYNMFTSVNWKPSDAYQQDYPENGATLQMFRANLGSRSDGPTVNSVGSLYTDLFSQTSGDNNSFDYYLQHEIPVNHSSLSMKNFLGITLKAAFNADADLTQIDFDESMQMIEYTNQSYRQLLEKLLPSIGCFITYDQNNEKPKAIKIDPTIAVSDTLTENDFSNLQIKLNTQDTYSSVNMKNESMFIGDNTRDNFLSFGFNEYYTASLLTSDLNVTNKEKFITMLTMESSRGSEIAKWHLDNKFIYKWSTPTTDRFLNLQLGDTIYINSDLVLEPSNQAKILITQRSISETSISFEGIKFASIN